MTETVTANADGTKQRPRWMVRGKRIVIAIACSSLPLRGFNSVSLL